jgi:membrane protein implicated in regulation of membrane protease activity
MLVFEIAGGIVLLVAALLSWRYILVFAAVLLAAWLCIGRPVLALIVAAIAIPGVIVTARATKREMARRKEEEQQQAWEAVRQASVHERRIARLGMRS